MMISKRILFPLIFLVLFHGKIIFGAETQTELEVRIEGIDGKYLENVLKYLSLEQEKKDPDLTESAIRRLYDRSFDEIRTALQPFGYYRPAIDGELKLENGVREAVFQIDLGKPVVITKASVTVGGDGAENDEIQRWRERFPLGEGRVLEHPIYERSKKELQELAFNFGYIDGMWKTHRIEVDPAQFEAEIFLHFDTGPRYRFGSVTFFQEILYPGLLHRYVPFQKGDPYRVSRLFQLQNDLSLSDYFSRVEVNPRRDLAEDLEVPIDVRLDPQPRNKYTLGFGYGTDTGFRGRTGWENRRINRRGHKMSAQARGSEIKRSFQTQYVIPLEDPRTEHLDLSAGWVDEDTDTSERETYRLGVSRAHLRGKWEETVNLNYEHETFEVGDEQGRSNLLIPGISWSRTEADDRINTRRGGRLVLDVKGAHKTLASDASFLQLRLYNKFIYGIGGFGRFIVRGDAGAGLVDEFSEVPVSYRFFTGGDQSVRGYAYNSLGPVNAAGEVIGGRHLLVGSIEYEQAVYGKWSVAVFLDAGNAIQALSDPYKKGSGFGIRWQSPIGSVRLDLAKALDIPGDRWRFHINIGPDL